MIGEGEVSDRATAHEVAHGAHGFLERSLQVLAVKIVDIDIVSAEAREAAAHGLEDPFA